MWRRRCSGLRTHRYPLYRQELINEGRKKRHLTHTVLHADGYDGYHTLPEDITVAGCWAHVRQKFDEALKALPERDREGSLALAGKRYCDKLFTLERDFAELPAEKRFTKRLERAKPVMDAFFTWCASCGAVPKSGVGRAAYYALSQRKYLERYLLDGRLEISNNRAERSIKPFVIDRKNFLFANTPGGARPAPSCSVSSKRRRRTA